MSLLEEIKVKSVNDQIPIVRDQTISFIKETINELKATTIFEVGSAYGYSALAFSQCPCAKKIITIEKDVQRFNVAKQFLKNETKIQIVNADAFTYEPKYIYDFIFIDGCKSHQEKLVDKYLLNLKPNGKMIIDNIHLQKFKDIDQLTKNQKNLIKKVESFKQ
jgi:predicted O-methyltransferase YrrM